MAYYEEDAGYIPPRKLEEKRNFWKWLILSLLTLGVYDIIFFMSFSFDVDKLASRHDGKKTLNYAFVFLLSLFTFSIVKLCWLYEITGRISEELSRRGIEYEFSTSDFWIWQVVGSLYFVGPFIFHFKLIKAMNLLCTDYNKEKAIEEQQFKKTRRAY